MFPKAGFYNTLCDLMQSSLARHRRYLKSFTLYVDGREVYDKEIADALETDLKPIANSGVIDRLSKYDTNPANNPQPPRWPGSAEHAGVTATTNKDDVLYSKGDRP